MMDGLRGKIYKALRWSERFTKTDMVYLAKGGSWLMLDRIVSMAAAFLLSVAFANLLPKETYGTYRYVLSIIGILSLSTLSGMGTAMARSSAQGNDGSLRPAIKAEMKWGLFGAMAALALGVFYFIKDDQNLAFVFVLVAFFIPFFNVYSLYASILNGKKRFDLIMRYNLLTVVTNFCLILPILIFTNNLILLILPFLFVNTFLHRFLLQLTKKQIPLSSKIDLETVSYGKQLSFMAAISTVATMADQVLAYIFLGPIHLAIYSMALAPTEQLKGVFKVMSSLALPKFSEQKKRGAEISIYSKTLKYIFAISVVIAVYILLAPILYKFIFPSYIDSILYSRILAVSLIAAASALPVTYLQAQQQSRELYYLNVYGSMIQLVLLLIGVWQYGLMGLVTVKTVSRLLELFASIFFAVRAKN